MPGVLRSGVAGAQLYPKKFLEQYDARKKIRESL